MYRTILIPLDGSLESEAILPHAEALAITFKAELILLRVAFTHDVEGVDPRISGERLAQQYLAQVQQWQQQKHLRARTLVRFGDPVQAILACATEEKADLIAMTTHGRTGVQRLLGGSVAEDVLRQGHLPLLLVHAEAGDAAVS